MNEFDSLTVINYLKNIRYMNPTHLGVVTDGNNMFNQDVVLCNITDENITIEVIAAGDTNPVSVVLTPGWNPIIVKQVNNATANTLIYGY